VPCGTGTWSNTGFIALNLTCGGDGPTPTPATPTPTPATPTPTGQTPTATPTGAASPTPTQPGAAPDTGSGSSSDAGIAWPLALGAAALAVGMGGVAVLRRRSVR
jgi:hypothetical protein